jgi:penicillin-insensitive murein endopeptidase
VRPPVWALLLLGAVATAAVAAESRCYGKPGHGRIENGVKLPASGRNFEAYSSVGTALGRTYVHSKVADIVVATYAELAEALPQTVYVYGETGHAQGGPLKPHRTHQNGLSVDFFMPVRDAQGRSVALPTGIGNKLGYDIEFDAAGKYGEYTIDFPALAEHLYRLQQTARTKGAGLALVIVDPRYLPKLFATGRGPWLRDNLPWMKGKPWVRHDEHYHVDFAVGCEPMRR